MLNYKEQRNDMTSNYATLGICVVTKNRIKELDLNLSSLKNVEVCKVIVNNGDTTEELIAIAKKHNCCLLDGQGSNSPHGQNIGFSYLKNKCTHILKSDDDIIYSEEYVDCLFDKIKKDPSICAISGSCWSDHRSSFIYWQEDGWKDENGDLVKTKFRMFRSKDENEFIVSSLHGSFIYTVKDAMLLEEATKSIRGGVFGEYFSQIAYGEETEFTHLLQLYSKKHCIYVPSVSCYHSYATGGIRDISDTDIKIKMDKHNISKVYKQLQIKDDLFSSCAFCRRR